MDIQENAIYLNHNGNQARKVVGICNNFLSYVKYDLENDRKNGPIRQCQISTFKIWAKKILVHPFKRLTATELEKFRNDIKSLLHAHRDCLRNQGRDTRKLTFDVRDGYYGEAFGMMRTLEILEYGYFGSNNLNAVEEHSKRSGHKPTQISVDKIFPEDNLKWWFGELEKEVLQEEGYYDGSYFCPICEEKY